MNSEIRETYTERYHRALVPVANALVEQLEKLFGAMPRVDRITARAKSIDRFVAKAEKVEGSSPKYTEPIDQIQDQIGARIVTFYKSDVKDIENVVFKEFRPIESKHIVPQTQWEFGYFGRHFILLTPTDLYPCAEVEQFVPRVFELQIKTLFQHAWSEANHDLGYKPGELPVEEEEQRLLAFTSAQAWGADRIFDDLIQRRLAPTHGKSLERTGG